MRTSAPAKLTAKGRPHQFAGLNRVFEKINAGTHLHACCERDWARVPSSQSLPLLRNETNAGGRREQRRRPGASPITRPNDATLQPVTRPASTSFSRKQPSGAPRMHVLLLLSGTRPCDERLAEKRCSRGCPADPRIRTDARQTRSAAHGQPLAGCWNATRSHGEGTHALASHTLQQPRASARTRWRGSKPSFRFEAFFSTAISRKPPSI